MSDFKKFTNDRKKRSVVRKARRITVLLAGVLVMLSIAWLGVQIINRASQPAIAGSSMPAASQPDASQGAAASAAPGSALADTSWNQAGPLQQTMETGGIANPDYRMIALPENGRVDMKYFDTVTFVGDSITQGLEIFTTGIPNAHYCAYKSIGPKGIYDGSLWTRANGDKEIPLDAIVASQPDNVYILLGANVLGNLQDDAFIEYYRTMLNEIRSNLLDGVGIYIQSITPVAPDAKFDMEHISRLNNLLAQLAYEEGVYFVDLNEPLADDNGFLREEFAAQSDGIHLTPAGYTAWVEYLVTHTAYHPRNPYLPGSPYYETPGSMAEEDLPTE